MSMYNEKGERFGFAHLLVMVVVALVAIGVAVHGGSRKSLI